LKEREPDTTSRCRTLGVSRLVAGIFQGIFQGLIRVVLQSSSSEHHVMIHMRMSIVHLNVCFEPSTVRRFYPIRTNFTRTRSDQNWFWMSRFHQTGSNWFGSTGCHPLPQTSPKLERLSSFYFVFTRPQRGVSSSILIPLIETNQDRSRKHLERKSVFQSAHFMSLPPSRALFRSLALINMNK
jgi:hypothetical protein